MDDKYHSQLLQSHRDALVAYYLGQLIPSPDSPAPDTIITPEDLYEFLLIDNQVSAEVDTSRIAQGIASIQQHIHAIYNGMEPGFGQIPDIAEHARNRQLWAEGMSQYSTWAAYQMLADYPENYLDPSLRIGKTEAFKAFESELSQARLNTDNVQKAVGRYLTQFEEISNLNNVCCYIDGVDFRKADYYFIGRQTVEPFACYWRKAAINLDDTSTHVPPSAWTEWKKIDIKTAGTVTHIRAVVVEGRLHVVWFEQLRQQLDATDKPVADSFVYALNVSYLQSNGQWSPAVALRECTMPSLATLEAQNYVLIATFEDRNRALPHLVIGFLEQQVASLARYAFLDVRDKHWQPVVLADRALQNILNAATRQSGTDTRRAQYPLEIPDLSGKVWAVDHVLASQEGDNHVGPLSQYLELEVQVRTVDQVCDIKCVGICNKPWYQDAEGLDAFRGDFGVWSTTPRSPCSLTLNGHARTPVHSSAWLGVTDDQVYHFGMPDTQNGLGYQAFTITRKERTDAVPAIVQVDDSQFLDLEALELDTLRYVRLNTTFASQLVRKAEQSLDAALGWEAQHTLEGAPPAGTAQPLDFNGANGRYFWELFFHVPHLVASRLYQSFDHAGAEQWLHYLFNPQVRVAPLYPAPPEGEWLPYWTSRPLAFADAPLRDVAAPRDPDTIAYGAPSHYRKAVFMLYLDNLIAWGDSLYRQVTRDTLNEAKLHYVRALSLLGPLSRGRSISQWTPMTLTDAASRETDVLARFESSGGQWLEQDTPRAPGAESWLRLIDAPWFRLPVNTRLLDLWEQLDARLYNLRNNLTVDGRPMMLALYEAPANPLDLLRAQLAGSSATVRRLGALAIIAPYRFAAMLPRARSAVDTLMGFGEQLRMSMEFRDSAEQQSLQQDHLLGLSGFVEQLDDLQIEQTRLNLAASTARREQVEAQVATYDRWLNQDVSDAERSAEASLAAASASRVAAAGMRGLGHGLGTAPNTVVFTPTIPPVPVPGGWNWSSPFWSAASTLEGTGFYFAASAEARLRADAQERRRAEWSFLKDQAQKQIDALTLEVHLQQMLLSTAQLKRERSGKATETAQTLYAFIQNRASNAALYQWLLSQMSTLYFQAYDAVLSLCLATEACWQYEMGDVQTRFVPVNAWFDDRHGLTAGESLALGLLQMESAYLVRNERRMELVKTVSLRSLMQDVESDGSEPGWPSVIAQLRASGTLEFQLKPSLFDQDYPGHYLRQLTQVSVSLPGVLGPYENARAVLGQLASSYLLKASLGGCKYLYQQAGELQGEHDDVSPAFVISNPRASQQIAISGDVEDSGLHGPLMGDERYRPFEGTGAVSRWTLTFPRHASARQQGLFDDLQDVVIQLRYSAMDGGKPFAEAVKTLLPTSAQAHRAVAQPKGI